MEDAAVERLRLWFKYIAILSLLGLTAPVHGAEPLEIKVVITTGVGSSIESASKNAAENALTQVVGTFIDTDTQLRQRKEIRDGIRSLSSSLDYRVSEFSQGSIASFETLDARAEGSIFSVEAKVGVRMSDFRGYVRRLASSETALKSNVFAQVSVAERNSAGARDILLRKIFMPLLRGELSDIRAGDPLVYEQLSPAQKEWLDISSANLSPTTILIPIDIRLREGVLDSMVEVLENIASGKNQFDPTGWPANRLSASRDNCDGQVFQKAYQNRGIVVGLHSFTGPRTFYLINGVTPTSRLERAYSRTVDFRQREWSMKDPSTWNIEDFEDEFSAFVEWNKNNLPKMKVTFKDGAGSRIKEYLDPTNKSLFFAQDPRFEYRDNYSRYLINVSRNFGSAKDLGCPSGNVKGFAIFPERRIFLVMNLPSSDLEVIKSVEVALVNP
jgi:hypothetical protein